MNLYYHKIQARLWIHRTLSIIKFLHSFLTKSTEFHSIWVEVKASFLFFLLFVSSFAFSQHSGIRGNVMDRDSKEALQAVTITTGNEGVNSDSLGRYFLRLLPGKYSIKVHYLGYDELIYEVKIDSNIIVSKDFLITSSDNVLQTAVVSESRYSKPIGESSVSIEVMKGKLIDHTNSTSVESAINKIPGVNVVGGQANIRGGAGFSYGAGSRVLLMIDDLPALQADAGYPNWDDIPVENINQIEVIKGAASAIYGSAALNGLIHVRTNYATATPVTKASVFYNFTMTPKDKSQKWWTNRNHPYAEGFSFAHAQQVGKLDFIGSTYLYSDCGANQSTDASYGRIAAGVRYRFNDRLNAGVNFNWNKRSSNSFFYWKDGVHAYYQPDTSTLSSGQNVRYYIDPFINYFTKAGDKHSFKSRIYHVDNLVSGGKSNSSTLWYGEYQYQKQFKGPHLVLTGGVTIANNQSNSELFSRLPFNSVNSGLYVQAEKKLWEKVTLSAGWRYEDYKLHRPEIFLGDTLKGGIRKENRSLFRFGINGQVNEKLFLRGSWGQGFRFPTLAEQFIHTTFGSTMISPNPGLKTERGWNAEIGFKKGFGIGSIKAYLDGAAFWSRYKDMMEFVFTGFVRGFQSQNIGDTDIKGYELSLTGQSTTGLHHWSMLGGYTFINPVFVNFDDETNKRSSADFNILKYRSKHMFKLDVEDQFGKWTFGSGILYMSKMEAVDAIFEFVIRGLKEFRATHSGYTILDLRASRKIGLFDVSLIMKNALNEIYASRPALMDAPRNLTLKLDYNFR